MGLKIPQSQLLEEIRQGREKYEIDEFVLEFLQIWDYIHQQALKLSVSDIPDFTKSILNTITLPFYEKFKGLKILGIYEGWVKDLSSIVINWVGRGGIMFPLRLLTYEVVNREEQLCGVTIELLIKM